MLVLLLMVVLWLLLHRSLLRASLLLLLLIPAQLADQDGLLLYPAGCLLVPLLLLHAVLAVLRSW
jgi:hypothetical protein